MTTPKLKHVEIFTDGACSGNPGKGGWGALLRFGTQERELQGNDPATTNNRMELMAVIAALESLKEPVSATICTDSRYVMDGITKWIHGWRKKNWRTAGNTPVKNVELWQRLEKATLPHKLEWVWVKGHSAHPENERADALARQAITHL